MYPLPFLRGKTIAVMGLAKSGMATVGALRNAGVRTLAWDDNADVRAAAAKSGFLLEDLLQVDWSKIDSLVLSPGIAHTRPAAHPVAELAKRHGVEIIGDVELLFRGSTEPAPRVIGVTGTNGKSTTTALIAHILKTAGKGVEVGGNLGNPVLAFNPLGPDGFYVIEVSSYQCELTPSAAFDVGVWMNITPDHFDRHGGMQGYVSAKRKMFRDAGKRQILVIGTDDGESRAVATDMAKKGHWRVVPISAQRILDNGVSGVEGVLYAGGKKLFSIAGAKTLPGAHNAQNVAAAYAACTALGLESSAIEKGILTYPGLPHRQQLMRVINGVRFINDSKATNADAAGKALACYDPIYWIIGGKPKEGGLNGLECFMSRVAHAFLIGQASDEFAAWLKGRACFTKCGTLEHAVSEAARVAAREAGKDAVVLLSPACASFDQFRSYEHRGEEFGRLVSALPHDLHA